MSDWNDGVEFKPIRGQSASRDLAWMIKDLTEQRDMGGLFAYLGTGYPPATRRAAAKALVEIVPAEKVPDILTLLETETDRGVNLSLIKTLGRLADDRALPALFDLFKQRDATLRVEAAAALARYNSETAYNALLQGLGQKGASDDYLVRQYSAEALGQMGDRRAVTVLINSLKDENGFVRAAAATGLGNLGDKRAAEALFRSRHNEAHGTGVDCAECNAIDAALQKLA